MYMNVHISILHTLLEQVHKIQDKPDKIPAGISKTTQLNLETLTKGALFK